MLARGIAAGSLLRALLALGSARCRLLGGFGILGDLGGILPRLPLRCPRLVERFHRTCELLEHALWDVVACRDQTDQPAERRPDRVGLASTLGLALRQIGTLFLVQVIETPAIDNHLIQQLLVLVLDGLGIAHVSGGNPEEIAHNRGCLDLLLPASARLCFLG